jgi:hypothetical protein
MRGMPRQGTPGSLASLRYSNADEWTGGGWVTYGGKTAVVFAGTKRRENFWYGFLNGIVWPDNPPYPEYPSPPHNDRG